MVQKRVALKSNEILGVLLFVVNFAFMCSCNSENSKKTRIIPHAKTISNEFSGDSGTYSSSESTAEEIIELERSVFDVEDVLANDWPQKEYLDTEECEKPTINAFVLDKEYKIYEKRIVFGNNQKCSSFDAYTLNGNSLYLGTEQGLIIECNYTELLNSFKNSKSTTLELVRDGLCVLHDGLNSRIRALTIEKDGRILMFGRKGKMAIIKDKTRTEIQLDQSIRFEAATLTADGTTIAAGMRGDIFREESGKIIIDRDTTVSHLVDGIKAGENGRVYLWDNAGYLGDYNKTGSTKWTQVMHHPCGQERVSDVVIGKPLKIFGSYGSVVGFIDGRVDSIGKLDVDGVVSSVEETGNQIIVLSTLGKIWVLNKKDTRTKQIIHAPRNEPGIGKYMYSTMVAKDGNVLVFGYRVTTNPLFNVGMGKSAREKCLSPL